MIELINKYNDPRQYRENVLRFSTNKALPLPSISETPTTVVNDKPVATYDDRGMLIFNRELCKPELHEYQKDGIAHMFKLNRTILGDDMGLGKTFQILEYCRLKGRKCTLVLCPKSVLNTWRNEINKWYGKSVVVLSGDYNTRVMKLMSLKQTPREFVICTYETFRQLSGEWNTEDQEREPGLIDAFWCFDQVVMDEGHKIKNRSSKIARIVTSMAIKDKNLPIIIATATPIMNRHEEIFPFLRIMHPFMFSNYEKFLEEYFSCDYDRVYNKETEQYIYKVKKAKSLKNAKEFNTMLSTWMLRRLRDDVLDLPDVSFNHVMVSLEGEQLTKYKQMETEFFVEFGDMDDDCLEVASPNIISQIARLKQMALSEKLLVIGDDMLGSSKLEKLLEMLEELPSDRKVIIFSQWRESIRRLQIHLLDKGIRSTAYHGGLSSEERTKSVKQFINNPTVQVLVGTTKALGYGIDGLQNVCADMIFMDLPWTPAEINQSIGRIVRQGQEHKVMVHIIEAENTIEQWIGQKLQIKNGIIEETIPVKRIKDYIKKKRRSSK